MSHMKVKYESYKAEQLFFHFLFFLDLEQAVCHVVLCICNCDSGEF